MGAFEFASLALNDIDGSCFDGDGVNLDAVSMLQDPDGKREPRSSMTCAGLGLEKFNHGGSFQWVGRTPAFKLVCLGLPRMVGNPVAVMVRKAGVVVGLGIDVFIGIVLAVLGHLLFVAQGGFGALGEVRGR